jgi:GNAT superfamily N-acetyltransferase
MLGLRPLPVADLPQAAELLLATNAGPPLAELAADLRRSLERWPSLQIAAYDGERLAGLVAGRLDRSDPTLGWSDDIVLSPSYRRQGLGGRLLEAQLAAFRALGCSRVRGLSPDSLASQVIFFQHYGFRVVGQEIAHGLWGVRDGERVQITECRLT